MLRVACLFDPCQSCVWMCLRLPEERTSVLSPDTSLCVLLFAVLAVFSFNVGFRRWTLQSVIAIIRLCTRTYSQSSNVSRVESQQKSIL